MDSEPRQSTTPTPAVCDFVAQPRMQDSNPKFEYEELDENEDEDLVSIFMTEALIADNKREFLRLIKSRRLQKEELNMISQGIIYEAAAKCAAAVLDGETNGVISPNFGFGSEGEGEGEWTVMHQVAATLCKELLETFLQRGFSVNVRSDWKILNYKNLLPLNVALRQLRYLHLADFCGDPIWHSYSLLFELCRKANELEVVRLLALNTRELKDEFLKYVKEGRMVEVGALLLAAGEKLMPLCISEGEDDIVFSSFKEISQFLKPKYPWSAANRDNSRGVELTLRLLDTYDIVGNQLMPYARPKEKGLHQDLGRGIKLILRETGSDAGFNAHFDAVIQFPPYMDSSNSSSFEWSGPMFFAPQVVDKWLYKQSQQPSIPTRQLFHTSSSRNIDIKYASSAPAKKLVNVNQNLNSCKKLVSVINGFRRGVRLV